MTGTIKLMIDQIIDKRSQGNPLLVGVTRTKLLLKGINPAKYAAETPDDPSIIEKLRQLSHELGVELDKNFVGSATATATAPPIAPPKPATPTASKLSSTWKKI